MFGTSCLVKFNAAAPSSGLADGCPLKRHVAGERPVWNVEVSALMVAGQHLVASSLDELPTPGYTIWNLRGYWQTTEHVLLTGGVEKLFNDALKAKLTERLAVEPGDLLLFVADKESVVCDALGALQGHERCSRDVERERS